MKRLLIILFMSGMFASIYAQQISIKEKWSKDYYTNQLKDDQANFSEKDSLGNIIIAGRTRTNLNGSDVVLLKYDQDGNLLWSNIYSGQGNPGSNDDGVLWLNIDKSNNISIVVVDGAGNYSLLKYDSFGSKLIEKVIKTTKDSSNYTSFTFDDLGNFYCIGNSYPVNQNLKIKKLDILLNLVWENIFYSIPAYSLASCILSGNKIYIASLYSEVFNEGIMLYRLNTNGTLEFSTRKGDYSSFANLVKDKSNSVYYSDTHYISKYDSTGILVWNVFGGNNYAQCVDDSLYVYDLQRVTQTTFLVTKYDQFGYSKKSISLQGYINSASIIISDGNNIYLLNNNQIKKMNSELLLAYTKDMSQFQDINMIPSNNSLFVTSTKISSNSNYDIALTKLGSNGAELWTKYYDGPGSSNDKPTQLGKDINNSLYVLTNNSKLIKYDSSNNYSSGFALNMSKITVIKSIFYQSNYFCAGSDSLGGFFGKFDLNGNRIWRANYSSGPNDILLDSINNKIFIASNSSTGWLISCFDFNSSLLWQKTILVGNGIYSRDIKILKNGYILYAVCIKDDSFEFVKLDDSGNIIERNNYVAALTDNIVFKKLLSNIYLAGKSNNNAAIYKFGLDGSVIWNKNFGNMNGSFTNMDILPDSNLVLSYFRSLPDIGTILTKIDQTGNIVWEKIDLSNGSTDVGPSMYLFNNQIHLLTNNLYVIYDLAGNIIGKKTLGYTSVISLVRSDEIVITGYLGVQSESNIRTIGYNLVHLPQIIKNNDTLYYGNVKVGESKILQYSIKNNGPGVFHIDSVKTISPHFSIPQFSGDVQVGDSVNLSVQFTPDTTLSFNEFLIIYNNSFYEKLQINLRGQGTPFYGDANNDKTVNVLDVTSEISYILNQSPNPFSFPAADVVVDNTINVLDVVGTINIILGTKANTYYAKTTSGDASIALQGDKVYLNTSVPITAAQFNIKGIGLGNIQFTPEFNQLSCVQNTKGDTSKIIIFYSMDNKVIPAGSYELGRLSSTNNTFRVTEVILADQSGYNILAVNEGTGIQIPAEYNLSQNYPNPFNPTTTIRYSLPTESRVSIRVYNVLGELVKDLVNTIQRPGYYETTFDAKKLSSGIYLYSVHTTSVDGKKNFSSVKKMILIK